MLEKLITETEKGNAGGREAKQRKDLQELDALHTTCAARGRYSVPTSR